MLYVEGTLTLLAELLESERHIGFYAYWVKCLLNTHGPQIKSMSAQLVSKLNNLQKVLTTHFNNLDKV